MTQHLDTQATTTAPNSDETHRGPSAVQLAAVVEAAYILEALRK